MHTKLCSFRQYVRNPIEPAKPISREQGFFRELFTGGFAESSHGEGELDVVLYDTNITRAGTPVTLSCIYGG